MTLITARHPALLSEDYRAPCLVHGRRRCDHPAAGSWRSSSGHGPAFQRASASSNTTLYNSYNTMADIRTRQCSRADWPRRPRRASRFRAAGMPCRKMRKNACFQSFLPLTGCRYRRTRSQKQVDEVTATRAEQVTLDIWNHRHLALTYRIDD